MSDLMHTDESAVLRTGKRSEEYISILVHQLRSSLATIRLVHQTLLENEQGNLTKEQMHLLKQAELRANRILYLTDDLLEPDTGAPSVLDIKTEPGSIEKLLEDIKDELNARFIEKGLEVSTEYAKNPKTVSYDYHKLQDAVRNILENAIKYTGEGGHVDIKTSYDEDTVKIELRDTGIGVSDDDVPKLFKKFERMKNATALDPYGLGLGLYIVRAIVEQHGGKVQYKHNEPKGSIFLITLPITM